MAAVCNDQYKSEPSLLSETSCLRRLSPQAKRTSVKEDKKNLLILGLIWWKNNGSGNVKGMIISIEALGGFIPQ